MITPAYFTKFQVGPKIEQSQQNRYSILFDCRTLLNTNRSITRFVFSSILFDWIRRAQEIHLSTVVEYKKSQLNPA